MLKSTTILLLCSLMLWSCDSGPSKEQQEPDPKAVKPRLTAGQIVDRAIEYHGGPLFDKAEMEFKFRDYEYRSLQEGGTFTLDRISYNDAIGKITDRVTNSGYTQVLNDEFEINIVDSMKVKFTNSVNSVHYFARLPYGLHAPAVEKKLIGTDSIKGRAYHEVEVRFKQEGGGVDFQDVFMYWFDTETGAMDYLAYSYETDGGGIRFRAAYNPREINGLRFQDYVNYKPQGLDVALEDLDYLYEQGSLIEVSKIELENVKVKIVDDAL